ncbi:FxsA family protein [Aliidiomarina halalkaliphila]|uniref:FxsA family protein n=1 Tax=Aliidiomarina halalkaliphila TaxID=2593535 RepID=A0A552X0H2_9GAMM|nr:FxsA family protein [Aliidiomarina halalkaliphila]TRW48524.1 FxsA family protein [Aliidiomarina halalkaliphila]
MFPVILLLFIVVPLIEILVLIQVGQVIGGLNTILLLIVTAVVGASLVRSQGLRAWSQAQQRMAMGEMPGQQLAEGMIIFMAGVMFVTPGFVTDIVAVVFLLPGFRQAFARKVMQRMQMHTMHGGVHMHGSFRAGPRGPGSDPRGPSNESQGGRTFEGEYKAEDADQERIQRDDRDDK